MELSFDEITKDIPHPNHPEVITTIKLLSELEKMDYFSQMQKYVTPVVLKDPDNGEILLEDDPITGRPKPVVHEQTNIPVSAMSGLLTKAIKSVKGLTNKGVPIVWDETKLPLLFKKELDVTEEGKDKQGFWAYLNGKIMDDATFFADPTENS